MKQSAWAARRGAETPAISAGTSVGVGECEPVLRVLQTLLPAMAPADLPWLIGALEALQATAWARLTSSAPAAAPADTGDENLSAGLAAKRLGVSVRWLYRNANALPFTVRIGRRLLFSRRGMERWNERQRAAP